MSDTPQGPGWWRASDGRYYPPEARPGYHPDDSRSDERDRGARPDEAIVDEGAPVDEAVLASEPQLAETPPIDQPPRDEPSGDATFEFAPEDTATSSASEAVASPSPAREPVIGEDLYERDWPVAEESESEGRRLWPVLAAVAVLGLLAGIAVWFVLESGDDSDATTTTIPAESDSTEDEPTGDISADDTADQTTSLSTDTAVSPYELTVGDCFDAGTVADDGSALVNVRVVDCEAPHQAEVVAIEDLEAPSDAAFPGDDSRDVDAQELCTPLVESFLGGSLAESSLLLLWLAPTEVSWEEGDREVVCVVAAPDGETLTGSMADTLNDGTDDSGLTDKGEGDGSQSEPGASDTAGENPPPEAGSESDGES